MTLLYYDPRFLDHDTGQHPEQPERLAADHRAPGAHRAWPPNASGRNGSRLRASGCSSCTSRRTSTASPRLPRSGGGRLDPDTVVSPASFDVAATGRRRRLRRRRSRARRRSEDRARASCGRPAIMRSPSARWASACSTTSPSPPPSHSKNTSSTACSSSIGTCTTATARRTCSTPTAASASSRSTAGRSTPAPAPPTKPAPADGLGATRNLPVTFGTPRAEYLDAFRRELEDFAARIRPQLVLLSAGFDSHRDDPIGSLGLEVEDFAELTKIVVDVAAVHAPAASSASWKAATTRPSSPSASKPTCAGCCRRG